MGARPLAPAPTKSVGWDRLFEDRLYRFVVAETFVPAIVWSSNWRYNWYGGHVRGMDVLKLQDSQNREAVVRQGMAKLTAR